LTEFFKTNTSLKEQRNIPIVSIILLFIEYRITVVRAYNAFIQWGCKSLSWVGYNFNQSIVIFSMNHRVDSITMHSYTALIKSTSWLFDSKTKNFRNFSRLFDIYIYIYIYCINVIGREDVSLHISCQIRIPQDRNLEPHSPNLPYHRLEMPFFSANFYLRLYYVFHHFSNVAIYRKITQKKYVTGHTSCPRPYCNTVVYKFDTKIMNYIV
jgi:hypothetical protein